MISQQTIEIVKSTAPILEEHGETLTRHFYKRMFSHNPEVAPFFNPANQEAGLQQRALAGAICAYAANIDNLGALGGAVELIAQKHASLQIKPEHYPIVGENLLASIREVLGEGATDDVINAWAEAYGVLADILIGREKQIYDENASKEGGWEGFKAFRIIKKEKESDIITSFYLKPVDPSPLPTFKAGQYITMQMPTADGTSTTMRNYSLSDQPGKDYFRISVKREDGINADTPNGYVSNLLHTKYHVDDVVNIAPPCGEFFLDTEKQSDRPLVLLAGGIGITPVLSMLLTALEKMPNRKIVFIHGARNAIVKAFEEMLDQLASSHKNLTVHHRYDELLESDVNENKTCGFIDAGLVKSLSGTLDADFYFCGPKPFMVNLYHDLLKNTVPADRIHFEFFGPRQDLENPKKCCPIG